MLSYLESSTPEIFHAAPSHLELVDRVQKKCLREIGVSETEALENFRLALLTSGRCMAMLAVLHRIVLGEAPPQLRNMFPYAEVHRRNMSTRLDLLRHNKQLQERRFSTDVCQRSLFGLVRVYNVLPQSVVDAPCTRLFQRQLQVGLRRAAQARVPRWPDLFSSFRSAGCCPRASAIVEVS